MDQMQSNGKINGCEIGAYSRLAKKCRECMNKDYCKNKRPGHEAYIIPPEPQINIDVSAMSNYGITADEAAETLSRIMSAVAAGIMTPNEARKNT